MVVIQRLLAKILRYLSWIYPLKNQFERNMKTTVSSPWSVNLLLGFSAMLLVSASKSQAVPVTTPGSFTAPMTVIDYSTSPAGPLPGGTSITTQYGAIGVFHDGSTTTPPGPSGMSSPSGLPGLESPVFDPDPFLPITISFTVPVNQVGAFYLMGSPTDSITVKAFRPDSSIIESITIPHTSMPLHPGPHGFNEGFVGLITSELIASVEFAPSSSAFVIDDLHFGVEAVPSTTLTFTLLGLGLVGLFAAGRRFAV